MLVLFAIPKPLPSVSILRYQLPLLTSQAQKGTGEETTERGVVHIILLTQVGRCGPHEGISATHRS